MLDQHMYDLGFEFNDDGNVSLEQDSGCGEVSRIDLHPCQIRLLAERAGLLAAPDPKLLDRLSERRVERLRTLAERFDELDSGYRDEIIDRCGAGLEIALHLRAIGALIDDLLEDVGNAESVTPALPTSSNEKSAAISVTPPASDADKKRRGRPAKADALSNAERQARHREKEAEAPRPPALALFAEQLA